MKNLIVQLDIKILHLINDLSGNPIFDQIMVVLSDAIFWVSIFSVIILYFVWKRRFDIVRKFVFVGICMAISDQISFEIVKQVVKRERPCWVIDGVHRYQDRCGGSYGFTSNHAANAGVAAFLLGSFFGPKIGLIAWSLAAVVGFSRVYLGVHFPLDVVGGYLLGAAIGWVMLRFARKLSILK